VVVEGHTLRQEGRCTDAQSTASATSSRACADIVNRRPRLFFFVIKRDAEKKMRLCTIMTVSTKARRLRPSLKTLAAQGQGRSRTTKFVRDFFQELASVLQITAAAKGLAPAKKA
jgi:hypothetical protein